MIVVYTPHVPFAFGPEWKIYSGFSVCKIVNIHIGKTICLGHSSTSHNLERCSLKHMSIGWHAKDHIHILSMCSKLNNTLNMTCRCLQSVFLAAPIVLLITLVTEINITNQLVHWKPKI